MSSISGVGGSGSDVVQFLQKMAGQQDSDGTSATAAPKAHKHHGGHARGDFQTRFGDALKAEGVSDDETTKIEDEIKSKLQSAAQDQGNGTDPRTTIKSTIDDVLKEHGLDPEAIDQQLKAQGGQPPAGAPTGQAPAATAAGTASVAALSTTNAQSTQQTIEQLMNSGNLDPATAKVLQSLLPSLDATA